MSLENSHALSQEDIDALFQAQSNDGSGPRQAVTAYDFRRSDRIPKEQIRALRSVHDTFARSLASSLSAYLRTYITVNVISVEQLSFRDFCSCLPSPSCLSVLRVSPYDGISVFEINPTLAFPLIEILLGGGKVKPHIVSREMTAIEQQILDSLLVLILQNLSLAWHSVTKVEFLVESHETEPALLRALPPNEAVVVVAIEVQCGETSGMMNIGLPANIVKLLRTKFDQQWSARKASASEDESARMLNLIASSKVRLEVELKGSHVTFSDLLALETGDILQFENSVEQPVTVNINGLQKYAARLAPPRGRRVVVLEELL
jgi:flagellar motor switch protein FliM